MQGKALPKGSYVLLWGILPWIRIVIPNIETLDSTIQVHRTLWAMRGYLNLPFANVRDEIYPEPTVVFAALFPSHRSAG